MSKNTPNIVFIVIEQTKASAVGCYGNPHVPTPFIDSLAEQGILFENAFANSPICTPSRASFLTGLHPLVHQSTCHQNRPAINVKLLPELLRDSGYYTGTIGHNERQRSLTNGFHEVVDNTDKPLGNAYSLRYSLGRKDIGWSSGSVPCEPGEDHTSVMTERSKLMVDEAIATGLPFFLEINYEDAHAPYFAPPPFDNAVDPETLPLPPRSSAANRPHWHESMLEELKTNDATDHDVRHVLAAYYGMIAAADDGVSKLYAHLKQRDLLEDTWLILTSDHGDYAGEKGFFTKTESLYECLLHVPLIIVPPMGSDLPRGNRVNPLVQLTDLFATMLGIADVPIPKRQSYDLIQWVRDDPTKPLHDYAFAQVGNYHGYLGNSMPGGMAKTGRHPGLLSSIRNCNYSLITDPDYGNEAYDLQKDPAELVNLLGTGQDAPPQIESMREALAEFERSCFTLREELGIVPGPRGFEKNWE